jgi:hypothetical protein
MYRQDSPVAIRTPAQRNLIGHIMIALPPVFSPSSSFPPTPFHCSLFTAKEDLVHMYKMLLFQILFCFVLFLNCVNLKLRDEIA